MRILNLNPNPGFEDNKLWRESTTAITELDPKWHARSLLSKIISLTRVAKGFDVVLLHSDTHLAALVSLTQRVLAPSRCMVFQGLLRDVSRYSSNVTSGIRNRLGLWFHRILVRSLDAVIVHTRAEVDFYSRFFNTPSSRFVFIPYFYYEDAQNYAAQDGAHPLRLEGPAMVLAIGRHRDYGCFTRALDGTSWRGCIVAGSSDCQALDGKVPKNIETYYEVSRQEYRRRIAQCDIVVLPFFADRWQRSLGQIAMFEAMSMRKPVITSATFHLKDYASNNEILFYDPEDSAHLRQQIVRLIGDADLRNRLVENAFARLRAEFTKENYITRLVRACQAATETKTASSRRRSTFVRDSV